MIHFRIATALLMLSLTGQSMAAEPYIETDFIDLRAIQPAAEFGSFGESLAVIPEHRNLLVAAQFTRDPDDSGTQDGSVFSFLVDDDGTLQFQQTLEPPNRNRFGQILAASGDWTAIGESGDKVHLYQRSGTVWGETQLLRIDPDVPATPGITVRGLDDSAAMDGSLLAIGDISANVVVNGTTFNNAGAVVLFRRASNNLWQHEATLAAPQPVAAAQFGSVVAVSGDTLLVGAPNDDAPDGSQGGAYVFQRSGSSWSHQVTLRNPSIEQARFGWSVAIDGDLAVVGCATCGEDPMFSNTGSFFAYERNLGGGNNWGLRDEFISSTPDFIDGFSFSLALDGNRLLVGARGDNFATLFQRIASGTWNETDRLVPVSTLNVEFGAAVALFANHAIVGLPRWPNTSGSERWGAVSSWLQPICPGVTDGIFCDGFED